MPPAPRYAELAAARGRQLLGRRDDALAGHELALRVLDRGVAVGRRGQLGLELAGQGVPRLLQGQQGRVDRLVLGVARRARLDRVGRGDQGEGAELADAGVELLVARREVLLGHAAQVRRHVGEDRGDHLAVTLVVVGQAGQVQGGGPDVRGVRPRAGVAGLGADDRELAAVGARRRRAVGGTAAVDAERLDAGAGKAREVGVDLVGVVTVVPGEAGVLRDAAARAG